MSRSSDKKYAPAWMTCGRLSFSASAKATMAGAISPWHSVASSQRLQRTRRWQKINDEMLMIEMIEMVIWLLWNIFLKSPKHAPLDWVQNGCCSNVPKGFKERLPHWRDASCLRHMEEAKKCWKCSSPFESGRCRYSLWFKPICDEHSMMVARHTSTSSQWRAPWTQGPKKTQRIQPQVLAWKHWMQTIKV